MDCPNCGQWNPDDKRVCWRCDAELPAPGREEGEEAADRVPRSADVELGHAHPHDHRPVCRAVPRPMLLNRGG